MFLWMFYQLEITTDMSQRFLMLKNWLHVGASAQIPPLRVGSDILSYVLFYESTKNLRDIIFCDF